LEEGNAWPNWFVDCLPLSIHSGGCENTLNQKLLKKGDRMCQRTTNADVARELSILTGMSFESAYLKTIRIDSPRTIDVCGNFNIRSFDRLARQSGTVNDLGITSAASRLSGKGFETVFMEQRMPDIRRF
jgi:hypothetical protein